MEYLNIKIMFLIQFLFLMFSGCYSLKEITAEDDEEIRIYRIETMNGEVLDFHDSKFGYALLIKDQVVITKINGEQEIYPASDIKKYYTYKTDKVFLITIGVAAALFIVYTAVFLIGMGGKGFGG